MYGMRSPPDPDISLMIITFGPQMPAAGLVNGYPLADGIVEVPVERALQHIDDVVRRRAAAVVSLVDDRALPILLREVVAVEARVPALACVRQVHVRQLSVRQRIDDVAVALDPRTSAQAGIVRLSESPSPDARPPSSDAR